MLRPFAIGRKTNHTALDMISANIMIADAKLNITYMNPAARALLQEAEADLKEELPRFSMATLIGSNIDIFHKRPSHQRNMLAALKTRHRATIRVGHRAFDLIVTPLKEKQTVSAFVVEWADAKDRIQNTDYRNQLQAIARVQAVIEFDPDGQIVAANDHFLKATGYEMEEIRGKSHRIFLQPGREGDEQFANLWAGFRANQPHIGDIVRFGKGGRKVFLNASYNPITDDSGTVTKVVKFATDVSERVFAVQTIGDALSKLADGNLNFSIEHTFATDFEALRLNMNEAVAQLGGTLASVAHATGSIDSGAREISASSNDLSKRTEQQAAALEQTAAALDEITVNVANASKRADEARHATEEANASAGQSGQIVSDAVDAMARIEQSSNQIANIIGVIDEIAFQTNLLALNAGVEAARAGEAGKGFAVVAQEVRELAQRSAKAAKEIKDLIRGSCEEVKKGVSLVSHTGEALKAIQVNVSSVNTHMQAIALSSREQATGLAEVNAALNQMDQVTQQNAAMVEQSTAAGATLAQEADGLRRLVGKFQLADQHSGRSSQTGQIPGATQTKSLGRAKRRLAVNGNGALKANDWE